MQTGRLGWPAQQAPRMFYPSPATLRNQLCKTCNIDMAGLDLRLVCCHQRGKRQRRSQSGHAASATQLPPPSSEENAVLLHEVWIEVAGGGEHFHF